MKIRFFLFSFFIVVCAFDFYGSNEQQKSEKTEKNNNHEEKINNHEFEIGEINYFTYLKTTGEYKSSTLNKSSTLIINKINKFSYSGTEKYKIPEIINKKDYELKTDKNYDFKDSFLLGTTKKYKNSNLEVNGIDKNSLGGSLNEENLEMNNLQRDVLLNDEKTLEFLRDPTHFKQIKKYPFAMNLGDKKNFMYSWDQDFEGICKNLLPEKDINKFKKFLKFYFCHKIIKKIGIGESGPFLCENKETFKDFLEKDIPLLGKRVRLASRFKSEFDELSKSTEAKPHSDLTMKGYIDRVIAIFHRGNSVGAQELKENQYMFLYGKFVLKNKGRLNKLFVRDLLSGVREGFVASIIKYRTFLFRFIPTFIYNMFDLGRFLKGFYTYSNDGRYSLSFHNVPLILGKTSPLFFDLFQFDFFFNFPLGVVLSCLDFCAYSILRGNLSNGGKKKRSLFQRFFLVWRPFVSEGVDIPLVSENFKNWEFKKEYYNAFSSVVLKVLTNFVGVNFNIKVKGNYFFSINLMSFVDDFILREYCLDSFYYFKDDFTPSSWSIFYVLDKER